MTVGPLPQRIDIYRATNGAKRDGMPQEDVWVKVASNIRSRIDPVFHYRSIIETLPEELVGREQALLFTNPRPNIHTRDIIVVTNDATENLDDKQYDVGYVNAVSNSTGVHHIESTLWLRDNPADLP